MSGIDAKVVLIGSANVGKTSIICRAISDEFDQKVVPTIGDCHSQKTVHSRNQAVNLQIWDTAGQERYRTLAPMYYRGSVVAFIVFSLGDRQSFTDVNDWFETIKREVDRMPAVFIVGNKADLDTDRTVTTQEAEELADQFGAFYFEVSAKTGCGIEDIFVRAGEAGIQVLEDRHSAPVSTSVNLSDSSDAQQEGGCKC
jgi:small GTP-binding protein